MSLSLQASTISTNNNVSVELKAEGVADKNDAEEIEVMIKEGV